MSRIRPGLCSVTLRAAPVDEIVRVAAECGLHGIEWGSDVHVPPGDLAAAARARRASAAADLVVASYGSYVFAASVPTPDEMQLTLDTAVVLGAPNVRVWAGFGVEPESEQYGAFVDGIARFCSLAAGSELTVGLEFHGGTPTATVAGTLDLLDSVDAPNLFTYWQPPYWREPSDGAAEVEELAAQLSHLHVYEWARADDRRPLVEGADRWRAVLRGVSVSTGAWVRDRYAFLEFVRDDDPDALRRDAALLGTWLADADPGFDA